MYYYYKKIIIIYFDKMAYIVYILFRAFICIQSVIKNDIVCIVFFGIKQKSNIIASLCFLDALPRKGLLYTEVDFPARLQPTTL